jgi:hypothetical protein
LTRRLWSWRDEFGTESRWSVELGKELMAAGAGAAWPTITRGVTTELASRLRWWLMGLEHSGYEERKEGLTAVDAARPGEDGILNRPHVIAITGPGDLKYAIPFIRVGWGTDVVRGFRMVRIGSLPTRVRGVSSRLASSCVVDRNGYEECLAADVDSVAGDDSRVYCGCVERDSISLIIGMCPPHRSGGNQ